MTNEDMQWLASLSLVSLTGPVWDVDLLQQKGFYKKPGMGLELPLDLPIDKNDSRDLVDSTLEAFRIKDRESYHERIKDFVEGAGMSANITKLMALGRTMDYQERIVDRSYVINGHPFMKAFFLMLMQYECHWPSDGFDAFDVANGIMLLRMGKGLGWLEETEKKELLDALYAKAKKTVRDYESFGKDAVLCRHIYCRYLSQTGNEGLVTDQKNVLSIAFHSIWQYMA